MKRVLLTVHKFFPEHKAGTEVLTLKVAQNLVARGYEVLVVTANPPDLDARHPSESETKDYVHEGINVHSIEEALRLKGYNFKHEFHHDAIKKHFGEILQSFRPDLLHIFHCQNLTAGIIDAATENNVPVVCSLTDFWFVCPVVQLKKRDGSMCRGPEPGARNCLTCYTPELIPPADQLLQAVSNKSALAKSAIGSLPAPVKALTAKVLQLGYCAVKVKSAIDATTERPAVLRDALNRTKSVMIPTKLMKDIFVENGINPQIIEHVPFGLDTSSLTAHQKKTRSQQVTFGFVGTIFEHKGLDLLIEAFQNLPPNCPASLKIYGDLKQFPDYGQRIEDMVVRGGTKSQNIEFCGTFPNSQLGAVLQNLDVLVVPSRWYENTPLVIQSAFATKTPVVATNLGGMSELIKHEQNGLLFELNDAKSLQVQLERLVADRQLLEKITDNIAAERTIEEMVDDIENIYEKVLRSARPDKPSPTTGAHPVSGIIST